MILLLERVTFFLNTIGCWKKNTNLSDTVAAVLDAY